MMALLRSQIDKSQQQSPIEQALMGEYNSISKFLDSKDYRNLPTGVNIDMLSQSDTNRMRQMMMGRDTSGQSAKGGMGQIAHTQRNLLNDQAARDWSGAYEEKIGGLMDRKANLGGFLQGQHANRMGQGVSGYSNMVGLLSQRPQVKGGSFWGDLLKNLIPGGASAALSFI